MVDFSRAPVGATQAARPAPVQSEEDLTHYRKGPLGDMAVVPDGYVGPMPAGAVSESDYRRMVAVYGNIELGQSSLRFDTSNFLKDTNGDELSLLEDPAAYLEGLIAAQQFRDQYMGYIQDLVKTPAGLHLLETLDRSKFQTRIQQSLDSGNSAEADEPASAWLDEEGNPSNGSGSIVRVDPNGILWDEKESCTNDPAQRWQPWMRDRPRFAFYHELVHGYHNVRGDAARDGGGFAQCTDYSAEIGNWEFQAAGIGPYRDAAVSENAIRAQMGAPLRPTYGGATYGAPNPWAQRKDDEEPPLHSTRR